MPSYESALQGAKEHGVLSLNFLDLIEVPPAIPTLLTLRHLDLGGNELRVLPCLSALSKLELLFLNDNPLEIISENDLSSNFALRFLDLSRTSLTTLPPSLSRLPLLIDVPLEGTHLEAGLSRAALANGTEGLLAQLKKRDERNLLVHDLRKKLTLEVWKEAGDTEAGQARLDELVLECSAEFPDNGDFKAIINNAMRLFGPDINSATPENVRVHFQSLRDDNERKSLGAELELAMRTHYFDAADPRVISSLRAEIVSILPSLDDTKFLIKHSRTLLPPAVSLLVPGQLPALILSLRARLHADRESTIANLLIALSNLYSDREPTELEALGRTLASPKFALTTGELRSLSTDVIELFPQEFSSAHPRKIVKAFRELQVAKGLPGKIIK